MNAMPNVQFDERPSRAQAAPHPRLQVNIKDRDPHDILVGPVDELPVEILRLGLPRHVQIFSSPTIYGLHGEKVSQTLLNAGFHVRTATFPDGEVHKNIASFETLVSALIASEEEWEADALIINLGGGVVMDVGAFVAATYKRGVRHYIQLPTTLLGDVDCGIGGKCGINLGGKNLVGQFYQPKLVLADLSFLQTLPLRELQSGLAEVIKYGFGLDAALLDYLEEHVTQLLQLDYDVLQTIVFSCFRLKSAIVEEDEFDTKGERAKLNFGHTFGHALEAATRFSKYTHGEAVAIGIGCACDLAEGLGLIDGTMAIRLDALCEKAGLPTKISGTDVQRLMQFMRSDKKFVAGKNRFVLPEAVGRLRLHEDVDETLVRAVLAGRMG